MLHACFRFARFVVHISYGLLLGSLFSTFKPTSQGRIRQRWTSSLLHILQVSLVVKGSHNAVDTRGCLFLANHISWLDVIALSVVSPAHFVAKSEVKHWPLLGRLCQQVGTLFIQREFQRDTLRINREITKRLEQEECIALFSEGTSTDGGLAGHFHSSLLQGVIDANQAICPVAIYYHDAAGKPNSDAAYVGNMSFLQSLWKILHSPSIHVTLIYLPLIPCANQNRRQLASATHASINTALKNQISN